MERRTHARVRTVSRRLANLNGEVRQRAKPGQFGPVVVGAVWRFRAYRNNRSKCPGPKRQRWRSPSWSPSLSIVCRRSSAMRRSGFTSNKIDPVSRIKPYDQLAITQAPMIPASGSIQSHSKARAKSAREQQADNHQHRHRRIDHHANHHLLGDHADNLCCRLIYR
jgi:hypothetical protein